MPNMKSAMGGHFEKTPLKLNVNIQLSRMRFNQIRWLWARIS